MSSVSTEDWPPGLPERSARPAVHADRGGTGDTVFLLLHGSGGTGAVWGKVAALIEAARARWVAPDLLGHGASGWAEAYSPALQAELFAPLAADADRLFVLCHSKGGLTGGLLASGAYGVQPAGLVILGCKGRFTEADLERIEGYKDKPPRRFEDRAGADERYLKSSGLWGLVEADDPLAARGVVAWDGGWRIATDPKSAGGGDNIRDFVRDAACPFVIATGGEDTIAPAADLVDVVETVHIVDGAAHNGHVTHPNEVFALLEKVGYSAA